MVQKNETSFEQKMHIKHIIIISKRTLITCYVEISRLSISVEQFSQQFALIETRS